MNIGTIIQWGSNVIPTGWLLCDGSAISRTTYADLFGVIGTNFGVGDGSTTFNLPDLRGRVAVGKSNDNEFDTLGEIGGEKAHTLTIDEMPRNIYTSGGQSGTGVVDTYFNSGENYKIQTLGTNINQPHNILQPYTVVNYIIKAFKNSEIKVSELPSATSFENNDYTMIVQSGENKKITKKDFNTYSTTETVIGKWINGKPIYRKVIDSDSIGALPNASLKSIAHGISNIELVINLYGMADNGTIKVPINYNNSVYAGSAVSAYLNGDVIDIGCSFDGTYYGANIILEYTKTTD